MHSLTKLPKDHSFCFRLFSIKQAALLLQSVLIQFLTNTCMLWKFLLVQLNDYLSVKELSIFFTMHGLQLFLVNVSVIIYPFILEIGYKIYHYHYFITFTTTLQRCNAATQDIKYYCFTQTFNTTQFVLKFSQS